MPSPTARTPPALVLGATWVLLCAMAAPAYAGTPVAPVGPETAARPTPIGTWIGSVSPEGGGDHQVTLAFTTAGAACSTGDGIRGSGTWWRTGPDRFAFRILETISDESGTHIFSIEVNQDARQRGTRFSSSGITRSFDPDGTPSGSGHASVAATRSSALPPQCP